MVKSKRDFEKCWQCEHARLDVDQFPCSKCDLGGPKQYNQFKKELPKIFGGIFKG